MTEPVGYIFHRSSGKLVHPLGGSSDPSDDTNLVVYSGNDSPNRLQVQFVPANGFGHFGYIKHVSSGKFVHPKGGSLNPGNDTNLVYHSSYHAGCLFAFDEEGEYIMHRDGKFWHPSGGSPSPSNDTECVLHSGVHDAAKFYFGDISGNKISPYPAPKLSGTWKMIKAFIDPKTSHTYKQEYKIGKSHSKQRTEHHAWKVSAEIAKSTFKASTEYSGFVEKVSTSTWASEYKEEATINVVAGQTIVVWQFVFGMEQYGEEYSFQSDIIGDTHSIKVTPPNI